MKLRTAIVMMLMLTGPLTLGLAAQAVSAPEGAPLAYNDAEAYGVYAVILPQLWVWNEAHPKMLVLRMETEPYGMCIQPDDESKKVVGSAIADYVRVNKQRWLLQREFAIEKPYELMNGDEWNAISQEGGWKKFYERYPDSGGWIEMSAVGFNADKTVAVVYMGYHCYDLCGGGTFYILQKKDGKWESLTLKGGTTCSWAS